jgi:hypothetical protein
MASERAGIERAVEEFYSYAQELVQARRDDPGDDLISTLIAAEEAGDKLSDVECINLVFNVLAGGVDTTQSQLAHAIRLLAEHPQQWALLREDPSSPTLAAAAVEEALRYEPITPFTARITNEEITFREVTFPAGTVVMVCAFTGNRDAGEAWTGAHPPAGGGEKFDITAWARTWRAWSWRRRSRFWRSGSRASSSTASRSSRASPASTGSESCPCACSPDCRRKRNRSAGKVPSTCFRLRFAGWEAQLRSHCPPATPSWGW